MHCFGGAFFVFVFIFLHMDGPSVSSYQLMQGYLMSCNMFFEQQWVFSGIICGVLATTVNSDEEIRLTKSEEEKVFIKNKILDT